MTDASPLSVNAGGNLPLAFPGRVGGRSSPPTVRVGTRISEQERYLRSLPKQARTLAFMEYQILFDREGRYAADMFVVFGLGPRNGAHPLGNLYVPRAFFEVYPRPVVMVTAVSLDKQVVV